MDLSRSHRFRCDARSRSNLAAAMIGGLIVSSFGCRPGVEPAASQPATPRKTAPLRVMVIDDPPLATAIEREWTAREAGAMTVKTTTAEEISKLASKRLGADVVIYPSALLGELATRRLISPLEDAQLKEVRWARDEILPLQRSTEVRWGSKIMGVSLGSPQFTVYYRRDIFERSGLMPPATWADYRELATELADPAAAGVTLNDDQKWFSCVEPLADGWAGKLLLARAAAYAKHQSQFSTLFDARTMEPLIAGAPFVRALEELCASSQHAPPGQHTPAEVAAWFSSGQCAMAIGLPRTAPATDANDAVVPTGFAELPGSLETYNFRAGEWESREEGATGRVSLLGVAGRLGSVTRECRQPRAGMNLLALIGVDELSSHVPSQSKWTTMFRDSHLEAPGQWLSSSLDGEAMRQYATAVQSSQSRLEWLSCLRLSGAQRYMSALDVAVAQAASRAASPADALEAAAEAWVAITEELGMEQQRAAYMQSIGRAL